MRNKILIILFILFSMLLLSSFKSLFGYNTVRTPIEDDLATNRSMCLKSADCEIFNLGKSREGHLISGYILNSQNINRNNVRRLDIISGMHGDEQTALYFTNNLFKLLLERSKTESNYVYYILPMSNPDAIIKNRRLITEDLNRVFANNTIDSPEEASIIRLLELDTDKYNERILLSIHAGYEGVLYPPGDIAFIDNTKRITYEAIGNEFCEALSISKNKCPMQSYFDYQTVGELADYYDKKYGKALTLEISEQKKLEEEGAANIVSKYESLFKLIKSKYQ